MKIEKYDLLKNYRNLTREYKSYHQPRSQVFKLDEGQITENVPVSQKQNVKSYKYSPSQDTLGAHLNIAKYQTMTIQ